MPTTPNRDWSLVLNESLDLIIDDNNNNSPQYSDICIHDPVNEPAVVNKEVDAVCLAGPEDFVLNMGDTEGLESLFPALDSTSLLQLLALGEGDTEGCWGGLEENEEAGMGVGVGLDLIPTPALEKNGDLEVIVSQVDFEPESSGMDSGISFSFATLSDLPATYTPQLVPVLPSFHEHPPATLVCNHSSTEDVLQPSTLPDPVQVPPAHPSSSSSSSSSASVFQLTTPTLPQSPTSIFLQPLSDVRSSSSDVDTSPSDVNTSPSDVSTPGLSGLTSGDKFLFPLTSDDEMGVGSTLTSLVKKGLKNAIQDRRKRAGKPELSVVDDGPPVKVKRGPQTAEETERYWRRRGQNRLAAQRFRQRQLDTEEILTKKCQRLEGSNSTLQTEIDRLMKESEALHQLLHSHLPHCTKPATGLPTEGGVQQAPGRS